MVSFNFPLTMETINSLTGYKNSLDFGSVQGRRQRKMSGGDKTKKI